MKKKIISLSTVLILTLCFFLNAHANLIVNGDFNSGLANWNTSGNISAAYAGPFAAIQGMDGKYALMGFGTTSTDSILWQEFDVTGLDQLTISFNWAFDYVDWSSKYDDAFISLYTQDGFANVITLQEIVTNGTLINPTSGLMSGFFTKTIDVSGLSGDDGSLRFGLFEKLGWTAESVAGIDNVSVESSAPVPEPATLLLLGSGLLGLANFHRKRK
jgi:hypothetical protein